MKIRGKITIDEHRQHRYQGDHVTVVAHPVYPGATDNVPEDQRFCDATPSGELTLVVKKSIAEEMALGKAFYLDLIPVEDEQPAAQASAQS